jgi:molybdopterin molybdotransferase
MVEFSEALQIIKKEAYVLDGEKLSLNESAGRILAQDVLSDSDMPPFNRAAMDGFACRRSDLGRRLEVIETVRAGEIPQKDVGSGECVKNNDRRQNTPRGGLRYYGGTNSE